ncbi:Uncharacterised protein [Nocardia farcinica]|nr:Uncharacterised protein [Nocardia farcinica]
MFDLAAWSGVVVLVLRLLRPETDRRWWLLVGVLVGVGAAEQDTLAVPVLVLVVALLVVGPRAVLRTGTFPVAVVAGLLIAAPNLWWQARSGWPQLEMSRAIAGGSSGTSDGRLAFVLTQFGLVGPLLAPVWLLGLWWLWRQVRYRAFALVYPALFLLFLVTGGKAYYLGGMYPVLLAAGAVAAGRTTAAARRRGGGTDGGGFGGGVPSDPAGRRAPGLADPRHQLRRGRDRGLAASRRADRRRPRPAGPGRGGPHRQLRGSRRHRTLR